MGKKLIYAGLLTVLILAAERSPAADEDPGKQLFMDTCQTCHRINGTGGDVGPDLSSVGARRDAEFIRQSILDPNAVVTEGYKPDIMPKNFKELFTEDQLNQLVTFLSHLKEPSKEATATSQDTKNPYTGNPQAIAEGQEIFLRLCAHCHGGNAEGGTCPDLTDDYWIFGGTDKVVYRTIVVGRKGTKMSGFWDSLKSDEVWKVIAYIRSKYKGSPEKIVW